MHSVLDALFLFFALCVSLSLLFLPSEDNKVTSA